MESGIWSLEPGIWSLVSSSSSSTGSSSSSGETSSSSSGSSCVNSSSSTTQAGIRTLCGLQNSTPSQISPRSDSSGMAQEPLLWVENEGKPKQNSRFQ